MNFNGYELALIDEAGYNGISNEHVEKVAQSLYATGLEEIDRSTFEKHCYMCGIDPEAFSQADLEKLQEKLNRIDY